MNEHLTAEPKGASPHTKEVHKALRDYLDFSDREDFALATRGLLLQKPSLILKDTQGKIVWDMEAYGFLKGDCPETVNPSLWRISQLNCIHGLFELAPGLYQVRGYDISYITFIEGKSGWICVDPITTMETAKAAKDLLDEYFGPRDISAVLYTHGHKDHYAGVKGLVSEKDVRAGRIPIYAPEHFLESAVSENVYAGQAMGRRSMYMYGSFLPRSPKGNVGNGIGMTSPLGSSSLIIPTDIISQNENKTIDGVDFYFILAAETEAPAEFMFYLPQWNALCTAELTSACLHNIYTIRGAEIRDAKAWAAGIDTVIEQFADDLELVFMSHHWPRWGKAPCRTFLEDQRDLYKFLHDQTLNLANRGYTPDEIGDTIHPPKELDRKWYSRGYHGTLSHNARGIYQKYLGFWDGNPATLNPLPSSQSAPMFVDIMGGRDAVLEQSRVYFEAGEYRFVAEVLNHLVFACPKDRAARFLLADTLEQLGYQSENGNWRNTYLTGALELRHGSPGDSPDQYPDFNCFTEESISGLTPEMLLDYLAIKLNSRAAEGCVLALQLQLTDSKRCYTLEIKNAVLNFRACSDLLPGRTTLHLSQHALGRMALLVPQCSMQELGCIVEGSEEEAAQFLSLFEQFPFWFNIIES